MKNLLIFLLLCVNDCYSQDFFRKLVIGNLQQAESLINTSELAGAPKIERLNGESKLTQNIPSSIWGMYENKYTFIVLKPRTANSIIAIGVDPHYSVLDSIARIIVMIKYLDDGQIVEQDDIAKKRNYRIVKSKEYVDIYLPNETKVILVDDFHVDAFKIPELPDDIFLVPEYEWNTTTTK
jgi:hypothetical protein